MYGKLVNNHGMPLDKSVGKGYNDRRNRRRACRSATSCATVTFFERSIPMKKSIRILALALALLTVVTVLASCGNKLSGE